MAGRPRLKTFDFNADKFRELIVYIAERCQDDPTFGAVKLNKILYYADFAAYRIEGQPITGATYRKLSEGPAPKEMISARDELIESGRLRMEHRPYFTRIQKRLVLEEGHGADRELFTPNERSIVDEVVKFFDGKSAREVSDYSHREPGWRVAEEMGDIPYETAWLSGEPRAQETEEAAIRIGKKLLAGRVRLS